MSAPYKHLTSGEKIAYLAAFLVALACLAVVLTTQIDNFHRAAQATLAVMTGVCLLILPRSQRRRR